jgi:hypothetical protein
MEKISGWTKSRDMKNGLSDKVFLENVAANYNVRR